MKNKNKKLILIVSILLVLAVGISLSYYVNNILINGDGASTKVITAKLQDTTFTVEGNLEFEDLDILPGHKNISKIKVTAKNNNELINYNLIWKGINGLSTPLKYYVYKSESDETPSITCNKETKIQGASKLYYETCTNNNFDNIGEVIASGTITNSSDERKIVLKENESITSSEEGTAVYYYVVLEFPNEDNGQNRDINKKFEGVVTVELYEDITCGTHNVNTVLGTLAVNSCEPDFTKTSQEADTTGKMCMYKGNSDLSFNDVPTEEDCKHIFDVSGVGYVDGSFLDYFQKEDGVGTWNSETSTCTYNGNNVTLLDDSTPTEEQCKKDIYSIVASDNVYMAGIEEVGSGEWVDVIGKTGIYEALDGMYGGTSYYYRGAVENNYLTFAGFCWRIVRINGDGSIRLIYDGTTCHANGKSTAENIITTQEYNTQANRSEYVGWTYKEGYQRPSDTTEGEEIDSNIKTVTEEWYNINIGKKLEYAEKVADSKFCNDREVAEGYTWKSQFSNYVDYAANKRIWTDYKPTLNCSNKNDLYILKVGLLTADEVAYAGGGRDNNSYYLYNGQYYWLSSPAGFGSGSVTMFSVYDDGDFGGSVIINSYGVRPIISLKSENLNIIGSGTIDSPYVVS